MGDVTGAAVTVDGEKKYLKSFAQDSNFLAEDIKHFLNTRSWEKGVKKVQNDDEMPF